MSRWGDAWRATVGDVSAESAVSTDTEAQERASQGGSVSTVSSVMDGEIDSDAEHIAAEPELPAPGTPERQVHDARQAQMAAGLLKGFHQHQAGKRNNHGA